MESNIPGNVNCNILVQYYRIVLIASRTRVVRCHIKQKVDLQNYVVEHVSSRLVDNMIQVVMIWIDNALIF